MADKTIGDLTQAESIGGEDLFVLQQNGEAKKLKGARLVKYAQDTVGAQVTVATEAAESAETAKTGAESAQTQAQAARDAILNMLVEAITLEQGSPATVEKSIVGSVYKLIFGLPRGKKGDPGATGPANTLTIGTVTSGAEVSATITGEAPNQVLNLVLQRGEKGDSGVYVGAGDMPEGYNVQIDPSGSGDEIVTAESIQSALGYTPANSADLADKLPKSPADWEPWTAEEQAAARERIGIAADGAWQCVTLTADDYDAENHRFLIDAGEGRQITEVYGIGQVVTDTPADADLTVGIGFGNANNTTFGVFGVYSIPTPNTHTSFSFEGKSVDFTSVQSNVYSQFGTVRYSVNKHDTPDFYIYATNGTAANPRSYIYWNNNNPRYFSIFGLWDNVTWAAIKIYIKLR